jgi:hypothetical protein
MMQAACGSPTKPTFFDCPKVFTIQGGNNQTAAAGTTQTSLLVAGGGVASGRATASWTLGQDAVLSVLFGALAESPR